MLYLAAGDLAADGGAGAELGVKLFAREGRKFRLTVAGEYFCGKSKVLLAGAEEMCAETKRIGSDSELKLDIGYLAGYYGYELQNAVVEFSRIYPEVMVNTFKGSHEALCRALKTGRANLVMSAISAAPSPMSTRTMSSHRLPPMWASRLAARSPNVRGSRLTI